MTLFIILVLCLAAVQSLCRLALLPRRWCYGTAALLLPLPFCFESAIAASSMRQVTAILSSASTLENLCALVVIQELFSLTAGFSLLGDLSCGPRTTPPRRKILRGVKFAVFLPSVLFPAGILYFQMYLFNRFPGLGFRALSGATCLILALAAVATTEGLRFFRPGRDGRLLTVLQLEYFLVFPAVFLPVAASAELVGDGNFAFPRDALLLLSGSAAAVLAATAVWYIFFKTKLHRKIKCRP
ncbi:MAG: hypothetical protein IJS01_11620 [Lentisphaeria bacterium]|nr:hypothetical protein [Lentisphaeria bacterium]